MLYTIFRFTAVLILTTVVTVAGAWAEEGQMESTEGPILVEEDALIVLADEPEEHFQKAHEDFLKKDAKAAATEIREGAAFLKLEAIHAGEDGKKALMASAHELEKLADDVEKGTVTSAKDLEHAFARAEHALARHHYLDATESWTKKESERTGHHLEAAAHDLEHAAAWSGHKLEAGAVAVVDGARLVAGKLIAGSGWVAEEVGKAVDDIGKEIQKLGDKIEPAKKA